jgi:histidine triad (HIT) family protein
MAFMDIAPIKLGHVLLIPKRHATYLNELTDEEREHLFRLAYLILEAQRNCEIAWDGANLLVNDGTAANQHIPHVHLHIVPRTKGDKLQVLARFATSMVNIFGQRMPREHLDNVAAQIRSCLG